MEIKFWGTRGSIAKPGRSTVRYGGNTSCVEVRSAGGTLLVLDCGTGAHGLGQALLAGAEKPVRGSILITHTHWDHIQGFPFFAPLFVPGNEWDVYAPRGLWESLGETLKGQMQYTYFPVSLDELGATLRYHDLVEGTFAIGDIQVTARYLNHPALTLGYSLEADGVKVVYATDHEPHARGLAEGEGEAAWTGEDRSHADFAAQADLLIHDTQYTAAEYPKKVGWGHSTVEYVADLAVQAAVRRLALFHHDALRDDEGVDALVEAARARIAATGAGVEVMGAAEGQTLEIERAEAEAEEEGPAPDPGREVPLLEVLTEMPVVIASSDPGMSERLCEAVDFEGLLAHRASDGEQALALVKEVRPSLLLVQRELPVRDALEVCRVIREDPDPLTKDIPVIVTAAKDSAEARKAGAAAGVTDWLIEPFSKQYACTRLRAWILRRACHWQPPAFPDDEEERLEALHALEILDTAPETRFDRITRLAQQLFRTPVALVSIVDRERQWFKSNQGLEAPETPREMSFCGHAILDSEAFIVPDALLDRRFADNPLVTGGPRVRFYAGYPVRSPDGHRLGTLCIIDTRPREMSPDMIVSLRDLAGLVESEIARGSGKPEP